RNNTYTQRENPASRPHKPSSTRSRHHQPHTSHRNHHGRKRLPRLSHKTTRNSPTSNMDNRRNNPKLHIQHNTNYQRLEQSMKTRKTLVLLAILLAGLILNIQPNTVHADQTLFYDDFTGNGQPANWKSQDFGTGTQTFQQGQGYLTLGQIGTTATITRIIANQTEPILSPATKDTQTIYMSWRLQPFNQTIQQGTRTAVEVDFGLRNCLSDTFQVCSGAKIGWKIGQQQGQLFNIGGNSINTPIVRTSQGIMFEIANLMIGPNPGDYP